METTLRLACEVSANRRLRLELAAGVVIVGLLVALVIVIGVVLLREATSETRRLNDVNIQRMNHVNLVLSNMMASGREQQSAVLFGDPERRQENVQRSLAAATDALDHAQQYRETLSDPEDIARWDAIQAQVEHVVALRTELFAVLRAGDVGGATRRAEELAPLIFAMNENVAGEVDQILASSEQIAASADDTARQGTIILIAAALLLTTLGVAAGLTIGRRISRILDNERRRAAAAIAESERRLNSTLSSLDEAVWSMALPGRECLYLNPAARALLTRPGENHGDPWVEVVHADDRKRVDALVNEAIRTGNAEGEFRVQRPGGDIRWLRARAYASFDGMGQPVRLDAIAADITERRRTDEALLQAQKLESLGVLAGGIAHDFNNLLVGILGNASLARAMVPGDSPARTILDEIELAGRRAGDLVEQMLAYSGKGQFRVERLNLGELVQEMTNLLRVSISKSAVLECHGPPDLPPAEGDATQLRQVIMNLVVNASEALEGHPGTITVVTGATRLTGHEEIDTALFGQLDPGEYVFVQVTDTGCGMDEETRAKLFEPFFTTKFAGRGLGMAAVLGIVRAHRGAILVHSNPGDGSTFRVLFPAAGSQDVSRVNGTVRQLEPAPGGTVLLVDDEATVRGVGARALESIGFDVLTAADGAQALDLLRDGPGGIRCVLADVTMPGVSGPGLLAAIKRRTPELPVVLMSGYAEQDITSPEGHRPDAFLQKPFTVASLRQVLHEVLDVECIER